MSHPSPLKLQVDSSDPEDARLKLTPHYCPHTLTVRPPATHFRARQLHAQSGGVGVYHLSFGPAVTQVQPVPFDRFVLVSRVLSGQFRVESGNEQRLLRTGDAIALDPLTAYTMQWESNCSILTLQLPRTEFERVAVDRMRAGRTPLRFPVSATPNPKGLKVLERVSMFLLRDILEDDLFSSPLSADGFRSFMAGVVLDTFPSPDTAAEPESTSVGPAAVRRAVAYMGERLESDLHLQDIASAAGVSPRALQEAFRKHLDTTPLAYLRGLRLQQVRDELRHRSEGQTVASVAYRWGFHNLGRFAQYYHHEFGQLPRDEPRGVSSVEAAR